MDNQEISKNSMFVKMSDLPDEIVQKIALCLKGKDVLRFCITSTRNYRICEPYFWKRKFIREFPELKEENIQENEYKQVYLKSVLTKRFTIMIIDDDCYSQDCTLGKPLCKKKFDNIIQSYPVIGLTCTSKNKYEVKKNLKNIFERKEKELSEPTVNLCPKNVNSIINKGKSKYGEYSCTNLFLYETDLTLNINEVYVMFIYIYYEDHSFDLIRYKFFKSERKVENWLKKNISKYVKVIKKTESNKYRYFGKNYSRRKMAANLLKEIKELGTSEFSRNDHKSYVINIMKLPVKNDSIIEIKNT